MKFILLIFAAIAAITVACVPPFNDFRLMDTNDTATAIQHYLLDNNMGWSEAVTKTNPHTKWPRRKDDNGFTVIKYCYYSYLDQHKFQGIIYQGWKLWTDRLGEPGPASGHSLKFEQFTDWSSPDSIKTCYVPKSREDRTLIWNKDIPEDTVVIKSSQDKFSAGSAIVGYIWAVWNDTPGRHVLSLSDQPKADHITVAHEIGHILGFVHEHQREDRDHYVKVFCHNLMDYDKKKAEIEARGKHTIEEVCEDANLGYSYDWPLPPSYSKKKFKDNDGLYWNRKNSKDYDLKSITHYDSYGGMNPEKSIDHMENFPLVRWTNAGPDYEPPEGPPAWPVAVRVMRLEKISDGDVDGVKALYPW